MNVSAQTIQQVVVDIGHRLSIENDPIVFDHPVYQATLTIRRALKMIQEIDGKPETEELFNQTLQASNFLEQYHFDRRESPEVIDFVSDISKSLEILRIENVLGGLDFGF